MYPQWNFHEKALDWAIILKLSFLELWRCRLNPYLLFSILILLEFHSELFLLSLFFDLLWQRFAFIFFSKFQDTWR